MRFFNTAGPIRSQDHYHIPPLERLELVGVRMLIQQKKYFVLHAPRQTGKTSALLALHDLLNAEDGYRCVYVNVEVGQAAREDTQRAMQAILSQEQLIVRRETHLDQLTDKLQEERVRRVVEPLLSGNEAHPLPSDDLMHVRDLGLISTDDPVHIANPIPNKRRKYEYE